jgi:hypothetical protein
MATRRRLAVLKGQWPEQDASMDVELLPFSQFVDNVTKKRSPEDEWRQHHDLALEVAITRKTLQKMALYHGSLIKVVRMQLHVLQEAVSKQVFVILHVGGTNSCLKQLEKKKFAA